MDFLVVILAVAGVLLALSVALGIYLWWPSRNDPLKRGDLGLALFAGAFVAFSIFGLQTVFDQRLHDLEGERESVAAEREGRERAADRDAAALNFLGLYEDLSDINLRDRDLSGLYLRGKLLWDARFDRAILSGAVLARADVRRASFRDAVLRGLLADEGNFADAIFTGADLRGSEFAGARLTNTDFRGADLRDADLSGAEVSEGGPLLAGAAFNSTTTFPEGVEAPPCRPDTTCAFPAR